ncbi:MAG: hypothetical protein LC111_11100 [Bacteroidia bacterium]|nr:hypothetical protein [Bacteroidia bacterium]
MENIAIYFGLFLSLVAAIIAAFLAWKFANFFIARREFYVKSPYDILMKKIGWCVFWFLFILTVGIKIVTPKQDMDNNVKSSKQSSTKHKDKP